MLPHLLCACVTKVTHISKTAAASSATAAAEMFLLSTRCGQDETGMLSKTRRANLIRIWPLARVRRRGIDFVRRGENLVTLR